METRLTREKLSFDEAFDAVRSGAFGGTALYIGTVRDMEDDRRVAAINYEAYDPRALSELAKGARKIEERFGARVVVFHRVGPVPVGEASVIIAAAAPHRDAAFDACAEIIEYLKRSVPICKTAFVPAE
ncbi:MAG: molybdenum cofactor biosynthesis protein MoaE [Elusimicrobia bacterium]|nr:molybdenum cofactor biosynthesis protein MoaE [Elusimicrobiota bacterium]